jgi:hypothetical protein
MLLSPIQSDVQVDINALTQQMANLAHLCKAAVSNKRILIDSGCNTTIIASTDHSDNHILYRESKETIAMTAYPNYQTRIYIRYAC